MAERKPGGSRAGRASRAPGQRPELGRWARPSPGCGRASLLCEPLHPGTFLPPFCLSLPVSLSVCVLVSLFSSLSSLVLYLSVSFLNFPGFVPPPVYFLSVFPFFPSLGSLSVCLCVSLQPTLKFRQCRRSRNSFLDRVKEAKPSPYRPPAPGAWPGSSPWN